MKKILLVILMLTAILDANAQFMIGVKGGLNVTRVSVSGNLMNNVAPENREGFFMGLTARCPLYVAPITLDVSALYNKMSAGVDKMSMARDMICIPVNAELNISKHLFVFAGPQLGFDITDKDYSLTDAVGMVNDYRLRDADLSLNIGGGIRVRHLQFTVNFNKSCGSMGDVDVMDVLGEVGDVVTGSVKADSWWLGMTYFF